MYMKNWQYYIEDTYWFCLLLAYALIMSLGLGMVIAGVIIMWI